MAKMTGQLPNGQKFTYQTPYGGAPGHGMSAGDGKKIRACGYCGNHICFFDMVGLRRQHLAMRMTALGWRQVTAEAFLCPACKDLPFAAETVANGQAAIAPAGPSFADYVMSLGGAPPGVPHVQPMAPQPQHYAPPPMAAPIAHAALPPQPIAAATAPTPYVAPSPVVEAPPVVTAPAAAPAPLAGPPARVHTPTRAPNQGHPAVQDWRTKSSARPAATVRNTPVQSTSHPAGPVASEVRMHNQASPTSTVVKGRPVPRQVLSPAFNRQQPAAPTGGVRVTPQMAPIPGSVGPGLPVEILPPVGPDGAAPLSQAQIDRDIAMAKAAGITFDGSDPGAPQAFPPSFAPPPPPGAPLPAGTSDEPPVVLAPE